MKDIPAPRWTARALAVLLWIAGSSYLIRNELSLSSPDWVVIATMPLIWAAVIALPILAHHAWKQGEYTAVALLSIAALVGSCFTLQGTISRQSEARDGKVAEAQASNFTRAELIGELARAKQRYEDANRYADIARGDRKCGQQCRDWELRAKEVKAHVDQLTGAIAALGADKPVASGEKRVAAAISMLPFVTSDVAVIEKVVATFLPSLFGLFLELAALSLAFYGWRPSANAVPAKEIKVGSELAPMADVGNRSWQTSFNVSEPLPSPELFSGELPDPPPAKRKPTKRAKRKDDVIAKIRAHTLKHGAPPSFTVVRSRHRLSNGSAHRYLKAALN